MLRCARNDQHSNSEDTKVKITYIVGIFPKLSETFVLNQITDLIDMGHDVEIISCSRPREQVVHESVERYGLLQRTHYLTGNQSTIGFELNERLVSAIFFTDIIHAHFAAIQTEIALKIARSFGIPYVFTAHAYDIFINPDAGALREKFESASKAITISDFNKEYLLNLLGEDLREKIEVVRCGVRLEDFKLVERKPGDKVRILLVGRFVEKKGVRYAIEAFKEAASDISNAELRIIGDGELKDEIVGMIDASGLREKVVLLGPMPQSAVLKEMEGADIFLLPSVTAENGDREGVPVSIMEASATGLPVVSSLHTGIPEVVIEGKTGFLAPEKDTALLARRLKELIRNPDLRRSMGKEGRANIERLYSHKAEMERLEGLFKELMKGREVISGLSGSLRRMLEERVRGFAAEFEGDIRQKKEELKKKEEELKIKSGKIREYESELQNISRYVDELEKTCIGEGG